MNKCTERLFNGVIKENPTFVLMLGMCPTLAVTTSAINGLSMGLCTMVVLAMSNLFISLLRKVIPEKVRIPAFIVVVATFVTIVQMLMQAYMPQEINDALGIYIPLIVVNCIILGRAEAYASKNTPLPSLFDGIGMGLGFSLALTIIGLIREFLGAGTLFNFRVMPAAYEPFSIFILAPGAFFVLSCLTALQNKLKLRSATNVSHATDDPIACGGNCMRCADNICAENRAKLMADTQETASEAAKKRVEVAPAAKSAAIVEDKYSEQVIDVKEAKEEKK